MVEFGYAWFPPFRCRSAVAVSPLPLRKFRKNSVSAVRITLPIREKFRCAVAVPTCPCAVTLPFRTVLDQILLLPFCRKRATNQRSGLFILMYTERRFQHFRSHLQRQRNERTPTVYNGTAQRHNGTAKRQRRNGNGRTATEWWKPWH